ncbi:unnamed protein product [Cuscuta europaea]|uniref:Uncharacterized protein n=1 Tax=Cuscuta europaea TaxID=41803 RepID=A0A9P0ZMG0_CUSEU|nr:unnamed protein product [Cuscuta europaea]
MLIVYTGIEFKLIIAQINKEGMARILWKPKGLRARSIATKKELPFLPQGDRDRDGIKGKAEKGFLYVTRPKRKPSATPDMVESLRHNAPIPRPNREVTTGRSNTISVAATKTEEGFSPALAAAYYDDLATKLWTNRMEILNVALGLAVISISMYVITGKHI